ncbi:hypothetical protein BTO05_05455 [Winogradskyella sp. PC-19]|uniref:hypothetical protein n=1 Tax=unclassified Winogradskyella TaxID=2615021 RepID=UPI000B3C199F|nr:MULTISPECIES: hypothetical protein [unclassified Winogradskyella]ARV09108.1 hypothetical protein BTO05_05455 [Winogradskyella sp. PC-19]RZN78708.1 MAG: hypothetical protein EVB12_05205 [Winogradskyella sp.]
MIKKISLVFFVCLGLSLFGQSQKQALPLAKYSDNLSEPLTSKERAFIDEVYGDYADKLVYNNPQRLLSFKDILRNRVVIKRYEKKDLSSLKRLSQVKLVKSINPGLQKDNSFNVESFNPLKYGFNFFSRKRAEYYRVYNTQYLITILPQH